MKKSLALLFALATVAGTGQAFAQDSRSAPGAGAVVVTILPGGATFFTQSKQSQEPSFGNYGLGGNVDVHLSRFVALEGDVVGGIGVTQDVQFTTGTRHLKSPSLVDYSGNLVVSAVNGGSVVPYVAGGVGGLTLLDTPALGIDGAQTFLTGNVGAGLKWFNGRWGLRADYRFIAVRSRDDAPAFFGQETRYGHRIYGGVLLRVGQ
jgi:hypothetical protein